MVIPKVCEVCGKEFDVQQGVYGFCSNECREKAKQASEKAQIGAKSLTDDNYDILMKEGEKQYTHQQFLVAWYWNFDIINQSNKISLDSLLNSAYCLMKAGEIRQYYFSEKKFTDTVHDQISSILAFAPDNLEAQELRAELYRKQELFKKAYATLLQIHGRKKDDLEIKFSIGEVLSDLGRVQDAVKHFEDLKKIGYNTAKLYPKLADAYHKLGDKEKLAGLVNIDRIFDTNDPSFGLIFAQVEYEMGDLESSLYVCKWLIHYHPDESKLWFLLEKIFQKLEHKKYAKFAQQTGIFMEKLVEQLERKFTELQEASFYDVISEQAFSNDKMREHLYQKYNINTKYPHMRQDEILELPYEERSFESILTSFEEESQHNVEMEKSAKEEEEMMKHEESVADGTYTPPFSDTDYQENEDFNEDIVAELQDCGLTDEEISDYQNLPAD